MTLYYFYSSANDELEIIEETAIENFAAHEFTTSMVFTGIAVSAKDFGDALKVYQNPASSEGEYIMIDEPIATITRRQIAAASTGLQQSFDNVKAKLEYLRMCLKLKAACIKLKEANRLINEASQDMFEIHNRPAHISPNTIFERLSDVTIKATIKYDGDTKKS